MIDDRKKAQGLIAQMKGCPSLSMCAGNRLIHMLEKQGVRVKARQLLRIKDVFYMGDEGGIMCALEGLANDQAAYVCSLTHLKVAPETPLQEEIQAYQRERIQNLELEAKRAIPGLKRRSK